MQTYPKTIAGIAEQCRRAQAGADTYTGDDGLLHCANCNAPLQVSIKIGEKKEIVPCACKCEEKNYAQKEDDKKREKLAQARERAFPAGAMKNWTFERDDGTDAKISNAMRQYAGQFKEFYKNNIGVLLYGAVGTGKTFYAACVVNAVIEQGYSAKMTNFSRVLNMLQSTNERQTYIDELCNYQLLVIDDLGVERQSQYALEQVYNVIDTRYETRKPLIITTNLSLSELTGCTDTERARIYDRVMSMCHPVEIKGGSRRMASVKGRFNEINARLGL